MSVCIVTNVRPEIHFIFDLSELLAQTSRTTIHWIQHTNQPVPPTSMPCSFHQQPLVSSADMPPVVWCEIKLSSVSWQRRPWSGYGCGNFKLLFSDTNSHKKLKMMGTSMVAVQAEQVSNYYSGQFWER